MVQESAAACLQRSQTTMSKADLLIETAGIEVPDQFRCIEVDQSQNNVREQFSIQYADRGGVGYLLDRLGKAGTNALAWQFSSEVIISICDGHESFRLD